ncbi:hypothetical protein DN752_01405 [Echinicola strongylocentroti]|uniref:Uncharacterized protein n=1 Tax=Echinicola strongylocentroti TaxID=1795355 RepID=A0A2Z4IEN1_9BACT|nr:hypothetical protein [Echinicola strongylocentroti]AWW28893.1 hypothetical protein DN752_01405 [Echinicola strongylocentroti]
MRKKIAIALINIVAFVALRWLTVIGLFLAGTGASDHAKELNIDAVYLPVLLIQIVVLYLNLKKRGLYELIYFLIVLVILIGLYTISRVHLLPDLLPY